MARLGQTFRRRWGWSLSSFGAQRDPSLPRAAGDWIVYHYLLARGGIVALPSYVSCAPLILPTPTSPPPTAEKGGQSCGALLVCIRQQNAYAPKSAVKRFHFFSCCRSALSQACSSFLPFRFFIKLMNRSRRLIVFFAVNVWHNQTQHFHKG